MSIEQKKQRLDRIDALGKQLSDAVHNAPRKETVTSVMLFAFDNAEEISELGIREIVEAANISSGYITDMSKAVRLTKYLKRK